MADLHAALRTEVTGESTGGGVRFVLVRLQDGKNSIRYALHAGVDALTLSGFHAQNFLELLGFANGVDLCPFLSHRCLQREVTESFAIEGLGAAFAEGYSAIQRAEGHFDRCGLFLQRPPVGTTGDGHRATTTKLLKSTSDEFFSYRFTWIEGERGRGWTTHYRPLHPPLSAELTAVLDFLKLRAFPECPEFDFEPCHWRYTPFKQRGRSYIDSNSEVAHRWFDAYATDFAPGVKSLLQADLAVRPFGMGFLERRQTASQQRRTTSDRLIVQSLVPLEADDLPERFDVAISFAGAQRDLAEQLATVLRTGGAIPFYDGFYPEQLWGKDLGELFDEIYRVRADRCVIFASREYLEREWTIHERRSAVARAIAEKGGEYILPIRVDDVELPGVAPTLGYISPATYDIEAIGRMLLHKLGKR